MSRFVYTPIMLDFLREGYRRMECRDLADAFNVRFDTHQTHPAIRSTLHNHGMRAGRRGAIRGRHKKYTPEQIAFLRSEYPKLTQPDLLDAFNQRFGLNKTLDQLKSTLWRERIYSGRDGCFSEGFTPWNKGKRCPGLGGSTTFRKGHIPANTRPMYSERLNDDGYIEIKVPERNQHTGAPTRFRLKHIWLWEQVHGPVPAGCVVVFTDGDRGHCEIGNLELMTREELARMNQLAGRNGLTGLHGEELIALRNLARLKAKTNKLERESKRRCPGA